MDEEFREMARWLNEAFGGEVSFKVPGGVWAVSAYAVVGLRVGDWCDAVQVKDLTLLSLCQAVSFLDEMRGYCS